MLGILLDTSFILPSLGIDTGERTRMGLQKLNDHEDDYILWYSHFSLLESTWVGKKLEVQGKLDRYLFELGLRSIHRGGRYRMATAEPEVFMKALDLASLGHRDMIDNLLYSISRTHNLKFLTLDTNFVDFIKKRNLEETMILPEDL
jgi:PIN domain nuclease of toxin-antitoxin system